MGWNSFEDIELWHQAREICICIWEIIQRPEIKSDRGICQQMLNSSGSIMDNIAEGFERGSNREFKSFLGYSKGSCGELRSQITRLFDRQLLLENEYLALNDRLITQSKRTTSLIKTIKSDHRRGFRVDDTDYT